MNKKKCKKLGNSATRAELREAHRIKMEMKRIIQEHNHKEALDYKDYVLANLSKNHEFYGDTPVEHERRKNGTLENNS